MRNIATAAQHKAQREAIPAMMAAAKLAPALLLTPGKRYHLQSLSIIGWAGPRLRGVLRGR